MAARPAPIPTRGSAFNSGGMVRPAWAVAVQEAVREAGCNPTMRILRSPVNASAAWLRAGDRQRGVARSDAALGNVLPAAIVGGGLDCMGRARGRLRLLRCWCVPYECVEGVERVSGQITCGRRSVTLPALYSWSLRTLTPPLTISSRTRSNHRATELRTPGIHVPKMLLLSAQMLAALIAAEASPIHKVPWMTQHNVKEALQRRGLIDQNHILTQTGFTALKTAQATKLVQWPFQYTLMPPEA
jgi:hypothetical protein